MAECGRVGEAAIEESWISLIAGSTKAPPPPHSVICSHYRYESGVSAIVQARTQGWFKWFRG